MGSGERGKARPLWKQTVDLVEVREGAEALWDLSQSVSAHCGMKETAKSQQAGRCVCVAQRQREKEEGKEKEKEKTNEQ